MKKKNDDNRRFNRRHFETTEAAIKILLADIL